MEDKNLKSETLNDLTIVIPSYERQPFIKRQVNFWSKFKAKIIILDGSKTPISEYLSNKKLKKNITYFHLPISIEERFKYVQKLIKTKYSALLSDDEYFVPSALKRCINELKNNQDLVSCKGQAIWFQYLDRKILCLEAYKNLNSFQIEDESPFLRMKNHMHDYKILTLWSVMKSDVFIKTMKAISYYSAYKSAAVAEIQTSLIASYSGKCGTVKELMWFRSGENKSIWWSFGNQQFHTWYLDYKNKKEKDIFLESILVALELKISQENIQMIKSAVNIYVNNRGSRINEIIKNINQILKKIIYEFISFFPLLKNSIKKVKNYFMKDPLMNIEDLLKIIKEKNIIFNKKEIIIISRSIKDFYEN